jgi:O-antigen ligase
VPSRHWQPWRKSVIGSRLLFAGLCGASAVLIGAAVPAYGALVVAALLAAAGAAAVVRRPVLGLGLLVATIPLSSLLVVGSVSFARLVGAGIVGVWLVRRLAVRASWQPLLTSSVVQVCIAILAFAIVSLLWSAYPNDTFIGLLQLVLLVLLCAVVIDQTTSWQRLELVIRVLVVAGIAASLVVLEQYYLSGARRAGRGVAGGINGTAATLVTIVPFAWHLLHTATRPFWRGAGATYMVLGMVAVAVTFSRSSYLLLPFVIAALVLTSGSIARTSARVVALAVLLGVAAPFVPHTRLVERIATIGPVVAQRLSLNSDPSFQDSRGFHWAVGWAMFRDRPIGGVGYNNYARLFRDVYQYRVEGSTGATNIYGSLRDPHSSHIAFLATGGVIGVILWLALLALVLRGVVASWKTVAPFRGYAVRSRVIAVAAALGLQVLYGWTLTVHQDRLFWLVVGLAVATARLTKRSLARSRPYVVAEKAVA